MKGLFKASVWFLVIALIILGGLFVTDRQRPLMIAAGLLLGAPSIPFNSATAAVAPDYTNDIYWAALPGSDDLADLVPAGVGDLGRADKQAVDVFFIHPTGLMSGASWTSNMQATSKTEENTMWMMANQASAYNGCCEVFAPRYREANIFTYTSASEEERLEILQFAYADVLAAFDNFLEHRSQLRPFIIASHSQGTHHGAVLLRERIDNTPLADRMVVAYLIGGSLSSAKIDGLQDITICDSATQLSCVVHYDTMSEQATPDPQRAGNICVNPLNWRRDGGLESNARHIGAVLPSGSFQLDFFSDKFTGIKFDPLAAPLPNHLSARCGGGVLYVTDQGKTDFDELALPAGSYHLLDYPLFYMDIRANAMLRTQAYLKQKGLY